MRRYTVGMSYSEFLKGLAPAFAAGYRIEQGGKHIKLYDPNGVFLNSISASPSDSNWSRVAIRDLNRQGVPNNFTKKNQKKKGAK